MSNDVVYGKFNVSDEVLKNTLELIALHIGRVIVTSGDRDFVPKGGSKTSLHLQKRAVDIKIAGMSLEDAFMKLVSKEKDIFDSKSGYEVILHGKFTKVAGPHLHIGRLLKGVSGVHFKREGIAPYNGKSPIYHKYIPHKKEAAIGFGKFLT